MIGANFRPAAGMKKTGGGKEWRGPCPMAGGSDCFNVMPNARKGPVILCRKCGDPSTGRLSDDALEQHARAVGVWEEPKAKQDGAAGFTPDAGAWAPKGRGGTSAAEAPPAADAPEPGAGGGGSAEGSADGGGPRWVDDAGEEAKETPDPRADSWIWTEPGSLREWTQVRGRSGKYWRKQDGDPTAPVANLLYAPLAATPKAAEAVLGSLTQVLVTEGASDCDALRGLGLQDAVARTSAAPGRPLLRRFAPGAEILLFPDHDLAGYTQARSWSDAALDFGLRVRLVDPLRLKPDAPPKWDARDWAEAQPQDAPEAAWAALEAALVEPDELRGRAPTLAEDAEALAFGDEETQAVVLRRAAERIRDGASKQDVADALSRPPAPTTGELRAPALEYAVRNPGAADADLIAAWGGAGADRLVSDAVDLDVVPPPRNWLVSDLIPHARLTMLTGLYGGGKSHLVIQMAAAVMAAADGPIVPDYGADERMPVPEAKIHGGVLVVSWEDETDEFSRRLQMIREADALPAGLSAAAVRERLEIVQMRRHRKAGFGELWGPQQDGGHTSTQGRWKAAGDALAARLRRGRYALAVVDPLGMAYTLSELDRGLVSAFANTLDALAEETQTAVLLVAHPPKSDELGYSGSTAWAGSVRSLLVLGRHPCRGWRKSEWAAERGTPSKRLGTASGRGLARMKGNYAPGADDVKAWLSLHSVPAADAPPLGELAWRAVGEQAAAEAELDPRAGEHLVANTPGDLKQWWVETMREREDLKVKAGLKPERKGAAGAKRAAAKKGAAGGGNGADFDADSGLEREDEDDW